MDMGYLPSFVLHVTEKDVPETVLCPFVKTGQIQNCCHPNALMTLKEFLMDYAGEETKAIGEALIQSELQNIPKEKYAESVKIIWIKLNRESVICFLTERRPLYGLK